MISYYAEVNQNQINDLFGYMVGKDLNKAIKQAANRASAHTAKKIGEEVNKNYLISAKKAGKIAQRQKATISKPYSKILIHGMHPNLGDFRVNPRTRPRITKTGKRTPTAYFARVKKDKSGGYLREKPKPFIAKMPSGKVGLFQRKTEKELESMRRRNSFKGKRHNDNIKGVYGPALPQMVKSPEMWDSIAEESQTYFVERLIHEVSFISSNYGIKPK